MRDALVAVVSLLLGLFHGVVYILRPREREVVEEVREEGKFCCRIEMGQPFCLALLVWVFFVLLPVFSLLPLLAFLFTFMCQFVYFCLFLFPFL